MANEEMDRLIEIMKQGTLAQKVAGYEQIYTYYYKVLYDYASFRLLDVGEAEDVVQDTLMELWENNQDLLHDITHKESLDTYLIEKITGKIANLNRKVGRNVPLEDRVSILNDFLFDTDLDKLELREYYEVIEKITQELPVPLRFTVFLLFTKRYSEKDTDRMLGVTIHQVRQRMQTAQAIMRKKLQRYYPLEIDIGNWNLKDGT